MSYSQDITNSDILSSTPLVASNFAGLIYFPKTNNCSEADRSITALINSGVTLDDLPRGFNLIPIILNSTCSASYLSQARLDQAEAAVFVNFSRASHSLNGQDFYNPVFGISWNDSSPLLENMKKYSGNMSTVPFAKNLSETYNSTDYVRLALTIQTKNPTSDNIKLIPFLVPIFGIALLAVLTVGLFHLRRRCCSNAEVVTPSDPAAIRTPMSLAARLAEVAVGGRLRPELLRAEISGRLEHPHQETPYGGRLQGEAEE